MTEPTRSPWRTGFGSELTPRDGLNMRRASVWTLLWVLSAGFATVALGERFIEPSGPLAVTVAIVPTVFGLMAGRVFLHFLREADEMQRKIHVEALALGFGAGMLFMMGYRLLERLGAPALDTSDPILVMVVFWALGQWLGVRRYA